MAGGACLEWTIEVVDLQSEWSFQLPQWLARIGRLMLVRRPLLGQGLGFTYSLGILVSPPLPG